MAKLCSCYALCPLVDRNPLGVTKDGSPGCAIVTLGKNIVIRYRLADQKEVSSWSSKDKISAPVIYDSVGQNYVAVVNNNIIRMWSSTDVDISKSKRHKLTQPIHTVLSRGKSSTALVVLKNGVVVPLDKAVNSPNMNCTPIIPADNFILQCFLVVIDGEDCVAIMASNDKKALTYYLVKADAGTEPWFSFPLKRVGKDLVGQTTIQTENAVQLITLWSDNQLWSLRLSKDEVTSSTGAGRFLYSLTSISAKNVVAITQISPNHVVIYGADPSEEGALLIVLNLQFLIIQARQHYKLFSGNANLWVIDSNLLLIVGHSIGVVPFVLDAEQLSALVGSHRPIQLSTNEAKEVQQVLQVEHVLWENQKVKEKFDASIFEKNGLHTAKTLSIQGYSQANLCEEIIPGLIEEKNVKALLWALENFRDFPETSLVKLITFCLNEPTETFNSMNGNTSVNGDSQELMEIDMHDDESNNSSSDSPSTMAPGRQKFLEAILAVPLSEGVFSVFLRSSLTLSHCLTLLQFITQHLPETRQVFQCRALLRWANALIDSHFQHLLLTQDEMVSNTISSLKDLVDSQMEFMDDLKTLLPFLDTLKNGQSIAKSSSINHQYTIEVIRLY